MAKNIHYALLLLLYSLTGSAQIQVPGSIPANTPVTFTSGTRAATYSWNFHNVDLNPASYNPSGFSSTTNFSGSSISYFSPVIEDQGKYYVFIAHKTGGLYRMDFGNSPHNTPLAPVNIHAGAAVGGVDVVYDETVKKWYVISVRSADQVLVSEMGNGLDQLPTSTQTLTVPDLSGVSNATIRVIKVDGMWYGFTVGWKVARIDFGSDLSNASGATSQTIAEGATKPTNQQIGGVYYPAMYKEGNNWYLVALQQATPSAQSFVYVEIGNDIKNNDPNVYFTDLSALGTTDGNIRGMSLAHTCGSLTAFIVRERNGKVHKLNFGNSIKNTPTVTGSYTPYGNVSSIQYATGYVYNDTFCLLVNSWSAAFYHAKMIPLTADIHKYYDSSATHTFTTAGPHDVTLILNQGGQTGVLESFCQQVNVGSGSGVPAVPDKFTVAPPSVCQSQAGVTYTVPAVSGATAYHWNYTGTGAAFTSPTTTPSISVSFSGSATDGQLQVWAVNASGDSSVSSRDTSITVHALPTINISPSSATICLGQSVTLMASGANTYVWSPSGGNGASAMVSPTTTTTYTVEGTNTTTGCKNTATRQVVVNALPTISISPSTATICFGESITLVASGANTYVWSPSGGNGASAMVSPTTTTTYTVEGTNTSTGCKNTATRQVVVNALPTISISPSTATICSGESITLMASGANTYVWSPSGGNAATATVSPTTTTTYTVEGTNTTTGCKNAATRQVVVNSLPNVTINPSTASICAGDSITLTAIGANTYTWTPTGGNSASIKVSPLTNTTYTVEGINTTTGCKNTATRQVVVNPLPITQLIVTGNITDICTGDSAVLTASGTGYNFQWMRDGISVGTGNRLSAQVTGAYRVIATDQNSGCIDSTQDVIVRVYDRPIVSLDQNDTSFCRGGMVLLKVSTADTGLTYQWKDNGVTNALATASFREVTETGLYKVIVGRSNVAMCEDSTNEVAITVHELPVIDVYWDGTILHATPGYVSYQWYNGTQGLVGENDSTFRPSSNGGYHVVVVDSNGCAASSPVYNLTDVPMGINHHAVDLLIFPNPTDGMVYIQSSSPVHGMLLTVDGRVLLYARNLRQINLDSYPSGVYTLHITNAEGVPILVERLIKQ